jgi:hypothetical protein
MFTGNFPVHDAPPISFLTSGRFGASPARAGPSWADGPAAPFSGCFFGLGSLSEFEKTMKLSSPAVAGDGFFAPPPPPGFPPFACPFLTILGQIQTVSIVIHVKVDISQRCSYPKGVLFSCQAIGRGQYFGGRAKNIFAGAGHRQVFPTLCLSIQPSLFTYVLYLLLFPLYSTRHCAKEIS